MAIGGKTSKHNESKKCEAYDTVSDKWINLGQVPFQCFNTTAVVLRNRYVYLMPGQNQQAFVNNCAMIGFLDAGTLDKGFDAMANL